MPRARRVATAVLAGVSALLMAVPGVAARASTSALAARLTIGGGWAKWQGMF
jgi:hypothetical protein